MGFCAYANLVRRDGGAVVCTSCDNLCGGTVLMISQPSFLPALPPSPLFTTGTTATSPSTPITVVAASPPPSVPPELESFFRPWPDHVLFDGLSQPASPKEAAALSCLVPCPCFCDIVLFDVRYLLLGLLFAPL